MVPKYFTLTTIIIDVLRDDKILINFRCIRHLNKINFHRHVFVGTIKYQVSYYDIPIINTNFPVETKFSSKWRNIYNL